MTTIGFGLFILFYVMAGHMLVAISEDKGYKFGKVQAFFLGAMWPKTWYKMTRP